MALDSNAYGSIAGVAAYVQHMANSGGSFDNTTAPTLTQVEEFLNQASDMLNGWLARNRYTIPVSQADAVRVLSRYANLGAAGLCELSMRSSGYSADDENRRENKFLKMFEGAEDYINSGALAALGAASSSTSVPPPLSGFRIGGTTTGGLALRPIFSRTMFGNNPTAERGEKEADYTGDA